MPSWATLPLLQQRPFSETSHFRDRAHRRVTLFHVAIPPAMAAGSPASQVEGMEVPGPSPDPDRRDN